MSLSSNSSVRLGIPPLVMRFSWTSLFSHCEKSAHRYVALSCEEYLTVKAALQSRYRSFMLRHPHFAWRVRRDDPFRQFLDVYRSSNRLALLNQLHGQRIRRVFEFGCYSEPKRWEDERGLTWPSMPRSEMTAEKRPVLHGPSAVRTAAPTSRLRRCPCRRRAGLRRSRAWSPSTSRLPPLRWRQQTICWRVVDRTLWAATGVQ